MVPVEGCLAIGPLPADEQLPDCHAKRAPGLLCLASLEVMLDHNSMFLTFDSIDDVGDFERKDMVSDWSK